MNNYINNLQEVKERPKKIHLKTVSKVEELDNELRLFLANTRALVKESSAWVQKWRKKTEELEKEELVEEKESKGIKKEWEDHLQAFEDDVQDQGADAMELAGDTYMYAQELLDAVDKLEKGAKQLGIEIPPIVKDAKALGKKADKVGGDLEEKIENLAYG